jgi:citrate lyase subunit beta/citryl-CoA lyase
MERFRWLRSLLFIPGHKLDWMIKAPKYGADALIFDLEDSVAPDRKRDARAACADALQRLRGEDVRLFVRVNDWASGELVEDVLAVVEPRLNGVVLPKVDAPSQVAALDLLLSDAEIRLGLPRFSIEILPLAETALAVERFSEICTASPRIGRIVGVSGLTPGMPGDLLRSLGLEATESGEESLYANGRFVVAARAAGVEHVLGGMTVDIANIQLLRRSLLRARQLGASGSMAIHPNHIPEIHAVFTPTVEALERAAGILNALAAAALSGDAAARYDGRMVDRAHALASYAVLARAEQCGLTVPEHPSAYAGQADRGSHDAHDRRILRK